MKINKYWNLRSDLRPRLFTGNSATNEQFDSVTIIHYGEKFRPIVLSKYYVVSEGHWTIELFYRELCNILNLSTDKVFLGRWNVYRPDKNTYEWGCRIFTKEQLKLIKSEMECYYSKKELGK